MRAIRLAIGVFFCLTAALAAETLGSGMTGQELIQHLRQEFRPSTHLGYREARQAMFADLDNQDGFVRLVYTGRPYRTSSIPNANKVNTEHTWPQSKFRNASGRSGMKTDLHHLFPTYNRVNGERGNKPLDEIHDSLTDTWWRSPEAEHSIPSDDLEAYSEATRSLFEPREDHKGNAARALAYFYVVYGADNIEDDWFLDRLETMARWNHEDPVDERERTRSAGIAELQGNENPFVLDPTAFDRCFFP